MIFSAWDENKFIFHRQSRCATKNPFFFAWQAKKSQRRIDERFKMAFSDNSCDSHVPYEPFPCHASVLRQLLE